jgi:hypothetical protein
MSSVRPTGEAEGALVPWVGTIALGVGCRVVTAGMGDADGEREGVDVTVAVG